MLTVRAGGQRERERERETITRRRWLTRRVSREQAPRDPTRRDASRNRDGRDNRRDEASRRHTLCSATCHVRQPLACNYRTNKGQGSPTPRIIPRGLDLSSRVLLLHFPGPWDL